jgi:aspartate racemase
MQKIGLIGGMNWESTIEYYEGINRRIQDRLGGWHSAELLLYSVDFDPILSFQQNNQWTEVAEQIINIAKILEGAGAKALVLCSNTIHKIAAEVEKSIHIPLIHIVDPVGHAIQRHDIKEIGLLGTYTTMHDPFYAQRLAQKFGIATFTPDSTDQPEINRIIYEELAQNQKKPASKQFLLTQIEILEERGAQGIILACTDLPRILNTAEITFQSLILCKFF